MLLILAFAYLLLLMMGLICRSTMSEVHWSSAVSKKKNQASAFVIGRYMQNRVKFALRKLLRTLAESLAQIAEEDWG